MGVTLSRSSARQSETVPDARSTFIPWGGIHPIIHPEDAITADAICTGEGEFAFQELYDRLQEGRTYRDLLNFWFKKGDHDEVRTTSCPS